MISRDEFNNIVEDLRHWRDVRNLTQAEQLSGIIPNLLEEVTEYIRGDSIDDKIDALCDICVFCFNAGDFKYKECKPIDIKSSTTIGKILELVNRIPFEVESGDFAKELRLATSADNMKQVNQILYSIVYYALMKIEVLGYNPYLAMAEVTKEINSRTGRYDKRIGKFIKDDGACSWAEAKDKVSKMTNDRFMQAFGEENGKYVFLDLQGNRFEFAKWYRADFRNAKR